MDIGQAVLLRPKDIQKNSFYYKQNLRLLANSNLTYQHLLLFY